MDKNSVQIKYYEQVLSDYYHLTSGFIAFIKCPPIVEQAARYLSDVEKHEIWKKILKQ